MGDGVFDSFPTCLMGNAGSECFLIFEVLFGPLVPCANDFYPRDYSGKDSLGLSLARTLVMLIIGGVICSLTCSLPCSAACLLGKIGSRGT